MKSAPEFSQKHASILPESVTPVGLERRKIARLAMVVEWQSSSWELSTVSLCTQDFVMLNHPVFFVKNAADYIEFQKALAQDNPVKFFFTGYNPLATQSLIP